MSEINKQESEFLRLLQELPFDDAPGSEHHKSLREQVLVEFKPGKMSETARPMWKHALRKGREIMRRPVPRLIAFTTACLAIAAVWLFAPGQQSPAQAFNKLAEAVVTAKTARFQMEVTYEGQPKQKFKAWFLAPGKFRQEIGDVINITDLSAGKIVSLATAQKMATVMNIQGAPKDKLARNEFERLRELLSGQRDAKAEHYERLEEKVIDGKRAVGFRLDSVDATVTLWGDPATGLPVRIESVSRGIVRTEVLMTDFEINVELPESLFDLTPPAGFKIQSMDVDASQSREQDLILAFRACSDISGGEFPETLDNAGINKLVIKYAMSRGKDSTDDDFPLLMKQVINIGRGFQFGLQLPESADAHYAGKGVKRDAKVRPIFWYRPEGAKKYRVIFADLTVQDADAAPDIPDAKRLEKASKASNSSK
jgi:outer membrane lipoprotein-sorting protein